MKAVKALPEPIKEVRAWNVEWRPSGLLGLLGLQRPIKFNVLLEDGHIAKIRASFEQPGSQARQMMLANKWNRERRFTKAFIKDNEDGMVLETDVDFEWLGQSPASSFKSILGVFKVSVLAFIGF